MWVRSLERASPGNAGLGSLVWLPSSRWPGQWPGVSLLPHVVPVLLHEVSLQKLSWSASQMTPEYPSKQGKTGIPFHVFPPEVR